MTDYEIAKSFNDGIPVCKCGAAMEMDFITDHFMCPNCGFEIEDLDEYFDNNPYSDIVDEWVFVEDSDDYDKPGEGCEACGGPYPDCKSSCSLFDN